MSGLILLLPAWMIVFRLGVVMGEMKRIADALEKIEAIERYRVGGGHYKT